MFFFFHLEKYQLYENDKYVDFKMTDNMKQYRHENRFKFLFERKLWTTELEETVFNATN